ncbi:MAG: phosphatidylinositol N-acetylglucosaminyltransferase subunit Y, partial [Piptocephalis tieghemiana]
DSTPFWGWVLLACSSFMWIFGMHCIFLSNWVPDTGSEVLDWLKHDQYYCLMLPLLLPTTMFAVFWNWTGLKFFRHN